MCSALAHVCFVPIADIAPFTFISTGDHCPNSTSTPIRRGGGRGTWQLGTVAGRRSNLILPQNNRRPLKASSASASEVVGYGLARGRNGRERPSTNYLISLARPRRFELRPLPSEGNAIVPACPLAFIVVHLSKGYILGNTKFLSRPVSVSLLSSPGQISRTPILWRAAQESRGMG